MRTSAVTEEMGALIREYAVTKSNDQIATMINDQFGTNITKEQVRWFKRKHGLKSIAGGLPDMPREVIDFIHKNYKGTGYQPMADLIKQNFGIEYPASKIRSYYRNHKLNSGLTGRWEKGHVVDNGFKKGMCIPGCEKTWFKKGQVGPTHVPVGTERLRANGFIWLKIAEPNKWRMKHLVVWESANGSVPKDCCLMHRDGDKMNNELDNLMLVKKSVAAAMNQAGHGRNTEEALDAAIMVAEMKIAVNKAKKRQKGKGDMIGERTKDRVV